MKPESRLAAPTPMKSRLTSGPRAGSEMKLRVVAEVCTMTMTLTISASGAISRKAGIDRCGIDSEGATPAIAPSVATPRPSKCSAAVDPVASASAIKAAGMRGLSSSPPQVIASTPRPMPRVHGLVSPRPAPSATSFSIGEPGGGATPSSAGAWEATMWTAMPARKPVVTGIESRSAMKPSRKTPTRTRMRPTPSASAAADAA